MAIYQSQMPDYYLRRDEARREQFNNLLRMMMAVAQAKNEQGWKQKEWGQKEQEFELEKQRLAQQGARDTAQADYYKAEAKKTEQPTQASVPTDIQVADSLVAGGKYPTRAEALYVLRGLGKKPELTPYQEIVRGNQGEKKQNSLIQNQLSIIGGVESPIADRIKKLESPLSDPNTFAAFIRNPNGVEIKTEDDKVSRLNKALERLSVYKSKLYGGESLTKSELSEIAKFRSNIKNFEGGSYFWEQTEQPVKPAVTTPWNRMWGTPTQGTPRQPNVQPGGLKNKMTLAELAASVKDPAKIVIKGDKKTGEFVIIDGQRIDIIQ
jgi:hypothetical protein